MSGKIPVVVSISPAEREREYYTVLTPFAFKHVQKQIHLVDKVVIIDANTARTLAGPMNVCATSCECSSFKTMDLPCSHMFAVRQTDDLPQFAAELVNERWTQAYNNSRVPLLTEPNVSVSTVKRKKVLSYNEKFRNTSLKLQTVSSKLAARGTIQYGGNMKEIDKLIALIYQQWPGLSYERSFHY